MSVATRNWLAAAISCAWVALAIAVPGHVVDRFDPAAKAVLETSVALIGTLAGFLAIGRYRRSRETSDLLVIVAVLTLAWVYTLFIVIPSLLSTGPLGTGYPAEVWGSIVMRIIAALFLVGAMSLRHGEDSETSGPPSVSPAFPILVGVAVFVIVLCRADGRSGLIGNGTGTIIASTYVDLLGGLAYVVASALLAQHARRERDGFFGWLSTGCVFAAFSLVLSVYFPFLAVGWVRPGDVLRALAVVTWGVGSAFEIRSYWASVASAAQRDSRRAVAVDLHDTIAQELALLSTFLHASADVRASEAWHREAQGAADRALAEARRTIVALSSGESAPIDTDLMRTAETVAGGEVDVRVEVESGSLLGLRDPLQRESIVRIVREAVTNSVRHGHAGSISIQLGGTREAPEIRVIDDGVGFDLDDVADPNRLGIVGMRERAKAIGATLDVRSTPGEGTTVELVWR